MADSARPSSGRADVDGHDAAPPKRKTQSVVLGPSPFDLLAILMLLMMVAVASALPVVVWIRELFR